MESTPQNDPPPMHGRPPLRPWVQTGVYALILLVFGALCAAMLAKMRAGAAQMTCQNNLKQIAIALHHYADFHKAFPSATMPNAEQPHDRRLSWRFEIDPYIHARMDRSWQPKRGAPWDAPENRALARKGTQASVCAAASAEAGELGLTHYVASLGVGADAGTLPLDDPRAGAFHLDLKRPIVNTTDYLPNTIIVFETARDIGPWAAGGHPTARAFLPEGAKPFARDGQFGGLHRGGANVVFADARVRFLSDRIDATVLRAYVTATAEDRLIELLEWRAFGNE
jgi:prepilin-type processing-associated H-X9-DG protein